MPDLRTVIVVALLLTLLSSRCLADEVRPDTDTAATPTVHLATIAPGPVYWQRFGHNTLIVTPPVGDAAVSYNFGYFDFEQEHFLLNFARGRMLYQALAIPARHDLPDYAAENRSVHLQSLALTPTQAERLAQALDDAVQPDNRDYLYDYFTANCSTRLRDALDHALDGELRRQTSGRSRGYTQRMHAMRLAEGDFWLSLGIDLGLGPSTDLPLSFWDEMFIPELMRRHLREVRNADGATLVADEQAWFESDHPHPPELARDRRMSYALTGIVLAIGLSWLAGRARRQTGAARVLRWSAFGLHVLFGLAGTVLLLLWLATDHVSAHGNENLFLLSPLSLPLAILWLRREHGRIGTALAVMVAISASFALASKTLPAWFGQANLHWCVLLIPVHLALLRAWWLRPPAAAAVTPRRES